MKSLIKALNSLKGVMRVMRGKCLLRLLEHSDRRARTYHLSRIAACAVIGVSGLTLAGCADLNEPDAQRAYDAALSSPLPAHWAASADAAAFQPEWLGFDSHGELRQLIDEAFEHNPDMRVAATRVEQARLQAELAGSTLWPTVNLGGKWSNSVISPDALSLSGVFATASWEVDVWGVARAGVKASEARYRSAEADYVYARASLGAAVAKAWLMNIEATRELASLESIDVDTSRQRDIAAERVKVGKSTASELAQSEARMQAAHEQRIRARQARESAQRSLELLLGRYPSAQIEVRDTTTLFNRATLPPIPAGVPLGVLDRRPDVIAARNAFSAAFFGSQQAKAARLPNVALTAGTGYLDTRAAGLQDQLDKMIFPVGARITWPLFDAGKRQTQYEIATVSQSEAAARYAQTIQRAMGEVENALAAERDFGTRAEALSTRRDALARTADLTGVQREVGQVDVDKELEARMDAARAQISVDQARMAALASRVDLHLALGGRFFDEGEESSPTPDAVH